MKNLVKVFSILALALGMLCVVPKTEVHAAPPAKSVYDFQIIGMADQDMFNNDRFAKFPGDAVETDGTIYVAIKQMGYGNVFTSVDGGEVSCQFKEVKRIPIEEYTSYGKIVAGWMYVYKIDNLTKGIHNVEFICHGTGTPYRCMKATAKINKL